MSNGRFGTGPAAGEYSTDPENQLQPEDTLLDRGVEDALDEGFSPPERLYAPGAFGPHENLSQHLAQEEPDFGFRDDTQVDEDYREWSAEVDREWEFPEQNEVGRVRAGRLVSPDMGFGEDSEDELVAEDVGISGGAASAEEAAVHIIDDEM